MNKPYACPDRLRRSWHSALGPRIGKTTGGPNDLLAGGAFMGRLVRDLLDVIAGYGGRPRVSTPRGARPEERTPIEVLAELAALGRLRRVGHTDDRAEQVYTVCGLYLEGSGRFAEEFRAPDAEAAERDARVWSETEDNGPILIAGVIEGSPSFAL